MIFFLYTAVLCVLGESTPPHFSFPPSLFLYVNLGAKAQKVFKTLAPQLTVLVIPHFLLMHIVAHCIL
jgi:hypothetical protein